jgi:hypothetical protein
MILALRQRHRRMFAVLGVLLPVAFAVGIAARRPVPGVNALPKELAPAATRFESRVWQRSDLFARSAVQVRLLRERAGAGGFAVEFSAPKDFVKPDLIVYWLAGNPNLTGQLPEKAVLLGAFSSRAVALPAGAANEDGVLVLFSLANQEIVDVSKPTRFNDPTM